VSVGIRRNTSNIQAATATNNLTRVNCVEFFSIPVIEAARKMNTDENRSELVLAAGKHLLQISAMYLRHSRLPHQKVISLQISANIGIK